ncbi:deoxyribonuclease IV [Patescibacteria group bacterium]|nr:deoxyribonuclease IV [Patescibacteria group bacterium]
MKLGAHIGISGGLTKAADQAHLVGCETLQVFTSNPKGWNFNVRSDEEIESFKNKIKEYEIEYVVGHSIYLINIASPNPYIYTNSINSLISGLVMAEKASFNGVVTHIGSHTGSGFEAGMKQILNALEQVLNTTEGAIPILLETDAGSGHRIGCKFSDIGQIIRSLKSDSIQVCLDTCHSFVSGYEMRTEKGLEKTLSEFDKEIGLDKLALIHLNDSKGDLGSNLDRHEVIGEGFLGLKTFEMIINHPKLKHLPGVIETPDTKSLADEDISLKRLKLLRK